MQYILGGHDSEIISYSATPFLHVQIDYKHWVENCQLILLNWTEFEILLIINFVFLKHTPKWCQSALPKFAKRK